MMTFFVPSIIFALVSSAGALKIKQSPTLSLDHAEDETSGGRFERAKVIFFAGVEGSGHHLLEQLTPKLKLTNLEFGGSWDCKTHWKEQDKAHVVSMFRNLSKDAVYVLPQQFSYPMCKTNGHMGRMTIDHPRLDWIKEAADKAGVDLHVIQLFRPMDDCLAADCLHREFEPCRSQSKTLVANGGFLAEHLRLFSKNQRSCFRYGEPEAMERAVTDSFGTQGENLISEIYKAHPHRSTRNKINDWNAIVETMQPIQNTLDGICGDSAQVGFSEFLRPLNMFTVHEQ